jgi:hypothetical protein
MPHLLFKRYKMKKEEKGSESIFRVYFSYRAAQENQRNSDVALKADFLVSVVRYVSRRRYKIMRPTRTPSPHEHLGKNQTCIVQ